MKNPFIELCGCICLTLLTLAPQPAAAKTAGEVPPADTLRTVFFTDIHVTPGNAQDSLFRIAVAEANASDADLVIFGGDLTNMGSDRELAHVHGLMSQLRKPWFTVPGNHETTWSESGCTTFRRLFGHAGCVATRAKGYLFLGYASAVSYTHLASKFFKFYNKYYFCTITGNSYKSRLIWSGYTPCSSATASPMPC